MTPMQKQEVKGFISAALSRYGLRGSDGHIAALSDFYADCRAKRYIGTPTAEWVDDRIQDMVKWKTYGYWRFERDGNDTTT